MSLLRLGKAPDGSRELLIQDPAVGRKRGHGGIAAGFLSGTYVVTESAHTLALRKKREWLREKRARSG